jgi:hypothetical protein
MQLSGIMRYKIEQLPRLTPPLRRGSTRQDRRGRQSRLSQAHDGRLSSKSHTNLLSLGII